MRKLYAGIAIIVFILVALLSNWLVSGRHTKPAQAQKSLYVAMGDSVAAGVGLKDDSDSSACDRTNQSYPYLLAGQRSYDLKNIACSGATLPAGILGNQDVNQLSVSPQLQQLFALAKPELISLTIGANDVDWTTLLGKCYTSECGSDADAAAVDSKLAAISSNLKNMLAQIQTHYDTATPRAIVTGYHQVFPATDPMNCTDLTGIDASELAFGRQLQTDINTTLQQAVSSYSFARYAPVDFSGHELCTKDPWVQGLLDKQPYHPTAAGQAQFARDITKALTAKQ